MQVGAAEPGAPAKAWRSCREPVALPSSSTCPLSTEHSPHRCLQPSPKHSCGMFLDCALSLACHDTALPAARALARFWGQCPEPEPGDLVQRGIPPGIGACSKPSPTLLAYPALAYVVSLVAASCHGWASHCPCTPSLCANPPPCTILVPCSGPTAGPRSRCRAGRQRQVPVGSAVAPRSVPCPGTAGHSCLPLCRPAAPRDTPPPSCTELSGELLTTSTEAAAPCFSLSKRVKITGTSCRK